MHHHVSSRLRALRQAMHERQIAAWIIPTGEPHLSEYLPQHWAFRQALSGFTGSAGTLVVTHDQARLWTDSRYWEQAERQLQGTGIALMRQGARGVPEPKTWLAQTLPAQSVVGIDPHMIAACPFEQFSNALLAADLTLVADAALLPGVWPERPAAEHKPIVAFECAQQARALKRAAVMQSVHAHKADALLLSSLDDIAWLTNLRGHDIACTPVFLAYLLVEDTGCVLYCQNEQIDAALAEQLQREGIVLEDYAAAAQDAVKRLAGKTVLLDCQATSEALFRYIEDSGQVQIVRARRPSEILKSRKSADELAALRETMRKDGVALCELFAWLEQALAQGAKLTEGDVAQKLLAYRRAQSGFIEESFGTISAVGANAALPHYQPSASGAPLTGPSMLLIDSGGQYTGGTTDITRTVALGEPTAAMQRDFTAVLRGHIALASARFPEGVFASQLDTLARAALWNIDADYGHGTGHGVGFCLSVHEGPVHISPRAPTVESSRVVPGLVLSNEPGVYRSGQWGVRTENLVTPVAAAGAEDAMQPMLTFETLSLCPIDTRLIDGTMLAAEERAWLNAYHSRVRLALGEHVSERARDWLVRVTQPI